MRVLLAHNRYQKRGGEDAVVEAEFAQLADAGADVRLFEAENDTIDGFGAKVATAARMANDPAMVKDLVDCAKDHRADVVHVHNFFPRLTPGAHIALAECGFPVVQTLHNYRLLCANAMFLRDGRVCEDCLHHTRLNAVRHACYRGSRAGSLAVAGWQKATIGRRKWIESVGTFIALTGFMRDKMVEGGLPPDRIAIKANSVADPGADRSPGSGALFVGRLSREKGIDVLLDAFAMCPGIELTVIGEGPELAAAKKRGLPNVTFLGAQDRTVVIGHMKRAALLVLPSIWYEGFPMTLVEAFSCGLPAIASQIGGIGEIVADGESGFLCAPGDPVQLAERLQFAFRDQERLAAMGLRARERYEGDYSPQGNAAALLGIYEAAMAAAPA